VIRYRTHPPLRSSASSTRRGQRGFTMIEVLIALVVLAVGLLGLAMLQTMNLRFTQSANQRTQATNLAYELLDQMRVNRVLASAYMGDYTGDATDANCIPDTGDMTADEYRTAWECRLAKALGGGSKATVALSGTELTVDIEWNDQRWVPGDENRSFRVRTQL